MAAKIAVDHNYFLTATVAVVTIDTLEDIAEPDAYLYSFAGLPSSPRNIINFIPLA